MNFIFLMDPLETIHPKKDTTLALMIAAQKKSHTLYYLSKSGISLTNTGLEFEVIEVRVTENSESLFKEINKTLLTEEQVDCLFIRTDPPFDDTYLFHTWVLDRLSEKVFIMNNPTGIRSVNEKIWATQFEDIIPNTLITSNKSKFDSFIQSEKLVIAKPYNYFGGQGIFKLGHTDSNRHVV